MHVFDFLSPAIHLEDELCLNLYRRNSFIGLPLITPFLGYECGKEAGLS
jgi:hypothetical protein